MKNRKKRFTVVIIVVIAVFIACSLFIRYWKPLHWAHTVRAEDISRIEVVVQPYPNGDANTSYKEYEADEFQYVTEKLNQYSGHVKIFPQMLYGGYTVQYKITMTDGKTHEVIVVAQTRLHIDKVVY